MGPGQAIKGWGVAGGHVIEGSGVEEEEDLETDEQRAGGVGM